LSFVIIVVIIVNVTGYAQLRVKKDILVAEVKKLLSDVARLGHENGDAPLATHLPARPGLPTCSDSPLYTHTHTHARSHTYATDQQKLDLQYLRSQEESFQKSASREEYEIASLLLEVTPHARLCLCSLVLCVRV
jgi:hypothetical protein